jgi:hypothetical protein
VLVSRFVFAKSALVLDFQFSPVIFWGVFSFLKRTLEKHDASDGISDAVFDQFNLRFNDESAAAYLLCWPLIAACSVKVDSRKGSFFLNA